MAHKLKTAGEETFCAKCGRMPPLYSSDYCNDNGHFFKIAQGIIFCSKCGRKAPVYYNDYCS